MAGLRTPGERERPIGWPPPAALVEAPTGDEIPADWPDWIADEGQRRVVTFVLRQSEMRTRKVLARVKALEAEVAALKAAGSRPATGPAPL